MADSDGWQRPVADPGQFGWLAATLKQQQNRAAELETRSVAGAVTAAWARQTTSNFGLTATAAAVNTLTVPKPPIFTAALVTLSAAVVATFDNTAAGSSTVPGFADAYAQLTIQGTTFEAAAGLATRYTGNPATKTYKSVQPATAIFQLPFSSLDPSDPNITASVAAFCAGDSNTLAGYHSDPGSTADLMMQVLFIR